MPDWVFPAILAVSLAHVLEEYFLPGGFLAYMKRIGPPPAQEASVPFAVVVNGLFLLLALVAAAFWRTQRVIALSVAALCLANGLLHIGAAVKVRGYVPGLVSSVLLYVPVAGAAIALAVRSGFLAGAALAFALSLGLFYHALIVGYLWIAHRRAGRPAP